MEQREHQAHDHERTERGGEVRSDQLPTLSLRGDEEQQRGKVAHRLQRTDSLFAAAMEELAHSHQAQDTNRHHERQPSVPENGEDEDRQPDDTAGHTLEERRLQLRPFHAGLYQMETRR
jgi:hypothetical protein